MNNGKEQNGNFWFGFFFGGLIGAFIIFILGTREGKKLAKKLGDRVEDYEEDLEQKVAKLQRQGEDFLEQAKDVKARISEGLVDQKQEIAENIISKVDQTLTNIEEIQKKGVDLTEEIHNRYFKKNAKPLS